MVSNARMLGLSGPGFLLLSVHNDEASKPQQTRTNVLDETEQHFPTHDRC